MEITTQKRKWYKLTDFFSFFFLQKIDRMRFENIFYQLKSIVIVTMKQYKFVIFEEEPIVMHCCVLGAIKNVVNNFVFAQCQFDVSGVYVG